MLHNTLAAMSLTTNPHPLHFMKRKTIRKNFRLSNYQCNLSFGVLNY